jgi:hypothetical protein
MREPRFYNLEGGVQLSFDSRIQTKTMVTWCGCRPYELEFLGIRPPANPGGTTLRATWRYVLSLIDMPEGFATRLPWYRRPDYRSLDFAALDLAQFTIITKQKNRYGSCGLCLFVSWNRHA